MRRMSKDLAEAIYNCSDVETLEKVINQFLDSMEENELGECKMNEKEKSLPHLLLEKMRNKPRVLTINTNELDLMKAKIIGASSKLYSKGFVLAEFNLRSSNGYGQDTIDVVYKHNTKLNHSNTYRKARLINGEQYLLDKDGDLIFYLEGNGWLRAITREDVNKDQIDYKALENNRFQF